MVKRTPTHLVVVKFEVRNRIVEVPTPEEEPEMLTAMQQNSFGKFLQKHNMVPPHMMGPEFDEENMIREELEERRDRSKQVADHEDDKAYFEITLVNVRNSALTFDCVSHNGEIIINRVKETSTDGIAEA